jgi:hypothetical protein
MDNESICVVGMRPWWQSNLHTDRKSTSWFCGPVNFVPTIRYVIIIRRSNELFILCN